MFKMVCVDVDGTLLNSKHKLTAATVAALRAAHELGVHIVISTGRFLASAQYYRALLGVSSGVIASNGAVVSADDGVFLARPFTCEHALRILQTCKRFGEGPLFYTPNALYTGSIRLYLIFNFLVWRKVFAHNGALKTAYIPFAKGWYKLAQRHRDELIRFEVINRTPRRIDAITPAIEAIGPFEIARSTRYNIEITAPGVNKGTAVELLAQHYGIARGEVLCIGDSENDLSMLRYAGLGVAMGNAPENVKAQAGYVTATNDEDGVAKAIERFILQP